MTRLGALLVCLLAAGLLAPGKVAAQKLVVAYSLSTSSVPLLATYEKGWFKEEGLEIELIPQPSGPKTVELIHLEQVHVGSPASTVLLTAAARGVNIMAVANNGFYDQRNPQQALVVKADGPVRTMGDLANRVVAVNGRGTHGDVVMRTDVFPRFGLTVGKNVTVVEMPWSQMEPALLSGRIDAGLVFEPYVARLRGKKELRVLSELQDTIPPEGYIVSALSMPKSYVQANPETVHRFLKAFRRGIQLLHTNRAEAVSLWNKWGKLPPEVMETVHLHQYTDDGKIPAKPIESLAEKLKAVGVIERVPAIESFVWEAAIQR